MWNEAVTVLIMVEHIQIDSQAKAHRYPLNYVAIMTLASEMHPTRQESSRFKSGSVASRLPWV